MNHDHADTGEFEAACPACELDEVSLQDTGRPWGFRLAELAAPRPAPAQQDRRTA